MLTLRIATEAAVKQLTDLVPVRGAPVLEEYFLVEGVWHITLSYFPASPGDAALSLPKAYKTFTIDSRSGEILSMKMRSV